MGEDDNSCASWDVDKDEVFILGELIGGYQLSPEEHVQGLKDKHLHPFSVVKFQDKTIHYSCPCSEAGRDPIWTVSTGSLFLLKVSPSTLTHDNLQVTIWSKKNVGSLRGAVLMDVDNYFLGRATLDGHTLLSNCNEQRLELPLEDLYGNEIHKDTTLALRFRLATDSDIRLIDLLKEQGISPPKILSDRSFHGSNIISENPVKDLILGEGNQLPIADVITEKAETKMAGDFLMDTITSAFKPSTKCDRETGLRKVRIKPGPDPTRIEETKYMTPFELSKETREPSQRWVEAGSGQIGTMHLEILSCHDLPNVDVGEAVGNLSDCFVVAVFEDVMLQTPVIDDELSPHWLPWTQRAFRVGIVHPSSILFLGVFDYDFASEHEAIGRVALNLTNFQSNTLYTLTYKLHPTSDLTERTPNGSITIRLRIEYNDEKLAVMAARQPRPVFHVNTRTQKTFKVLRYTCFGEYDIEEQFAWAVTRSYISEILEYWRALKFYLGECFWSLLFWRGQVHIFSMHLPVHSAILFSSGAVLIERPWLIVPFYCLFVAWFMLASMAHRRQTPSPWHTCTPFLHFAEVLLKGKSSNHRERIRPAEFLKQTEEYEKAVTEWEERYQSSLDSRAAMEEKLMEIGNENISTEVSGQMIPMDLLERLGRYQGMIGRFCTKFRRIKSIIIWEDSMTSFWITAKYLLAGLITLILPWRTILYFVGKVIVWGVLGPQMKIVDLYLESRRSQQKVRELEDFRKQTRLARIRREEAVKLKDMKCLAFGEYVTLVPSENLPRHYDRPLHESRARYVGPSSVEQKVPATSKIPGQQLYGSMIPHTKSGLVSHQEEERIREMRLASLEEQVTRLQSIEEHLSSRPVSAGLDRDLPDQLGYEVTLCDDLLTHGEESQNQEHESPTPPDPELTASLSEKCMVAYSNSPKNSPVRPKSSPISKFFTQTACGLVNDSLVEDQEKEKEDEVEAFGNEEKAKEDECTNTTSRDHQTDDRHSENQSFASEEGVEVDEEVDDYVTPLLTYPKAGEKNEAEASQQSFVDKNRELDPDASYLTPTEHQSEPDQELSSFLSLPSQDSHTEASNNGNDKDGAVVFATPRHEDETEDQQSPFTWAIGSHDEEEKKEQDEDVLKSKSDLTFMTPVRDDEEKNTFMTPECGEEEETQQEEGSALDFLELKLHDRDEISVKDENSNALSRHQLMGPRQKAAAVSVRSIGSGSMSQSFQSKECDESAQVKCFDSGLSSCKVDQSLDLKWRDESVSVRSIGIGSLRGASKDGLVMIQGYKVGDEEEEIKSEATASCQTDERLLIQKCKVGDDGDENKLVVSTSYPTDMQGIDEAELPTPVTKHHQKAAPSFEESVEPESSLSTTNETPAEARTVTTVGKEQSSVTDESLKETGTNDCAAVKDSNVTAETDFTANHTAQSIMTTDTDVTAITDNMSSVRLPSCSMSLRNEDVADPMLVRKTWSSGSLQRESTWIKENPTDSVLELSSRRSSLIKEEGLEIVAMGRLRTIGEPFAEEEENGNGSSDATATEPESPNRHGLSVPYRSNSYVQVAHYRP